MATVRYLQSVKNASLKYRIIAYDPATKTATLQGVHGTFPISPFTKEKIIADGYTLVTEEEPSAA